MSTMFKYRVHEVAKDFKLPTKTITEILSAYATTPKKPHAGFDDGGAGPDF